MLIQFTAQRAAADDGKCPLGYVVSWFFFLENILPLCRVKI